MNQPHDLIGRAARLSVARDACIARGMPVPASITSELQRIETTARARLSPQQLSAAMHHFEVARMRVQQDAVAAGRERTQAEADAAVNNWFGKVTSGMLGQDKLTKQQVHALAHGQKVPIQQSKRLSQPERDAAFRERTRSLDPQGRGWSEAEYARRMDALADAGREEFNKLAQNYNADPSRLRHAAHKWKNDRLGYGLQKRREDSDRFKGLEPATPVITERDRRRAAIISAYAKQSADEMENDARQGRTGRDSDTYREIGDELPLETLNETDGEGRLTRRAVMARALESQESDEFSDE